MADETQPQNGGILQRLPRSVVEGPRLNAILPSSHLIGIHCSLSQSKFLYFLSSSFGVLRAETHQFFFCIAEGPDSICRPLRCLSSPLLMETHLICQSLLLA